MAGRPDECSHPGALRLRVRGLGVRGLGVRGLVMWGLVMWGLVAALASCSALDGAPRSPHASGIADAPGSSDGSSTSRWPPHPPTPRPAHRVEDRALAALEQWDRQRSAAYAAGSTMRLHRLYVPGSKAGAADVGLLRHYLRRGFHVRGMRTQVLAASVLDHRDGRWRLSVTDRLVGAVATRSGRRVRLPQGRAGGYVLTLVRDDGHWLMASTRRAPEPLS